MFTKKDKSRFSRTTVKMDSARFMTKDDVSKGDKGVIAIRRTFCLAYIIKNTKLSNCPNFFLNC